jgi:toxin ParE1/3/4
MSLPLIVTPEAEADVAEARAWYEDRREGLGEEFVLCVEAGLEHIRRAPMASREVQSGVRRVVVRRFPYGIFYRVDPDQIAVLAVYHTSRDPRGWQERTEGPSP